DEGTAVYEQFISPEFFKTMGISLVEGREFTEQDIDQSSNAVIISESFARRYWPDADPIGKRLRLGKQFEDDQSGSKAQWKEVVGVAPDVKHKIQSSAAGENPSVYFPLSQSSGWTSSPALLIRTSAGPDKLVGAVRQTVQEIDSDIPIYS